MAHFSKILFGVVKFLAHCVVRVLQFRWVWLPMFALYITSISFPLTLPAQYRPTPPSQPRDAAEVGAQEGSNAIANKSSAASVSPNVKPDTNVPTNKTQPGTPRQFQAIFTASSAAQGAKPIHVEEEILTPGAQLIMAEHKKCSEEIKMRLESEERWFDLKFTFIGVIILGFFAHAIFKEYDEVRHGRTQDERVVSSDMLSICSMTQIMKSQLAVFVIGLATVVSIMADMHIRSNRCIIAQNGLWMAYFAEPAMLGEEYIDEWRQQIVGWEQFLRLDGLKGAQSEGKQSAYYKDTVFSLFWWPHMFLVTVMMYGAFLLLIRWQTNQEKTGSEDFTSEGRVVNLVKVMFIAVHCFIVICAVSTQCAPSMFRVVAFGFEWNPRAVMTFYCVIAILMSAVAYWGVYKKYERRYFSGKPAS